MLRFSPSYKKSSSIGRSSLSMPRPVIRVPANPVTSVPRISSRGLCEANPPSSFSQHLTLEQKMQSAMIENLRFIKDPTVAYYRGLGLSSLGTSHFEEAVASFEKAILLDPRNVGVLANIKLAQLYKNTGHPDRACELLEKASDTLIEKLESPEHTSQMLPLFKEFSETKAALADVPLDFLSGKPSSIGQRQRV